MLKVDMTDGGSPALPAPQPPQVMPHSPPGQPSLPPAQPIPTQPIQPAHMPQLNWSHFKPKDAGELDEDVEGHLLRTNDLMGTHIFPGGVKV